MGLAGSNVTSRRHRLMARIHRSYATITQEVRVGENYLSFTRIANPDTVLDQVAAEADRREKLAGKRQPDEQLHLPYWAELWDSAVGIGQFLHTSLLVPASPPRPPAASAVRPLTASPTLPLSSTTVLDLGCGMGLSGTIAASLGARVVFADIEPPALLFAQLNSLPWADRVRTRQLNWQRDDLHEQFPLILGADILYERAQWEYLEPFWRRHLAPGGRILLGEPGRQTGDLFLQWIAHRAWNLRVAEEVVPTRAKPVRIFQLSEPG
jgi:predicted nicotinamide N-methyase